MITKFIEPWILFPGNLVILLAGVSVVLFRTHRHMLRWGQTPVATRAVRASAMLLTGVAVLLYLSSITVIADRVMGALERTIPPASPAELTTAEAVVVLGGGVVYRSPAEQLIQELDGKGVAVGTAAQRTVAALSPEAESRLLYGVRLAHRLRVPLVVSGGRVLAAEVIPPEAEVAAALARDLGIPGTMLRVEADSRTTAENARLTAERFDYQRVIVVTSAYHMRRSLLAFDREGLSPIAAPAAYRRDQRPLRPVMFLPGATNLRDTATVLRERVGFLWYRLTI